MRPEAEWFDAEKTAVPASTADWRAVFECIDSRGRFVDRTGDREIRHKVRGAAKICPGMASIGWYLWTRANHGDGGSIYGGWRRLSDACDLDRSTVFRCRTKMRKAGWLRLVRAAGQDGMPRSFANVYELTIPFLYTDYIGQLRQFPTPADSPAAGDLPLPPYRGRHGQA
jgi:hypothetical protein